MDTIKFTKNDVTKDSFKDWGLIPIGGLKAPEANGKGRTGKIDFLMQFNSSPFAPREEDLLNFFADAKDIDSEFSVDPGHTYHGSWKIAGREKRSNGVHVSLSFSLAEFKMSKDSVNDDWKWDDFNFDKDVVTTNLFTNKLVSSTTAFESIGLTQKQLKRAIGDMPVKPIFRNKSESDMIFKVNGVEYTVPAGKEMSFDDAIFDPKAKQILVQVKGYGYYDISFRKGVR